jgi:hypothetical protein
MTDLIPVVTQAEVRHDFVLGVTFDDGTVGEVDLASALVGRCSSCSRRRSSWPEQ